MSKWGSIGLFSFGTELLEAEEKGEEAEKEEYVGLIGEGIFLRWK